MTLYSTTENRLYLSGHFPRKSDGNHGDITKMKIANETTNANQSNDSEVTTVTAPEIVCGGCASSITKAFADVEGVSAVEVDVPTKRVTVHHDQATSRERIVEVLDRAGYSAE